MKEEDREDHVREHILKRLNINTTGSVSQGATAMRKSKHSEQKQNTVIPQVTKAVQKSKHSEQKRNTVIAQDTKAKSRSKPRIEDLLRYWT